MRIAHLSDVHILDRHTKTQAAGYRLATKLVSLGRAIDPRARARNLGRALAAAKAANANHVVISGDLTEVGESSEFELFAEVLADSGIEADAITLVPGNHDAYTRGGAFQRALEGPLRPYSRSSAGWEAGRVVERDDVVFLPVDTSYFQAIAWAGGIFTRAMAEVIDERAQDPCFRHKAIVLVVHHPPFPPHRLPVLRWVDGLQGFAEVLGLMARHPRLQLLHGHLHRVLDRVVMQTSPNARHGGAVLATLDQARHQRSSLVGLRPTRSTTQVFGAPAICDDAGDGPPKIRLYDIKDGALDAA